MTVIDPLLVLGGFALLIAGGNVLVDGATSLALRLRVPPLVVGLTIVSVATSAPELAVVGKAITDGEPDLAVGSVVGSNIANVLLVLGVAAGIGRLTTSRRIVRRDLPLMCFVAAALLLLGGDGRLSRLDGAVLFAMFVLYVALGFRARGETSGADTGSPELDVPQRPRRVAVASGLLVTGVASLVAGAAVLVTGAVNVAGALGLSPLVIGLTVVAVGTSLPELAAAIAAVRRGHRDLAVGSVVGSNIANLGLVLGLPALVTEGLPVPPSVTAFDGPVMAATCVLLVPVALTGHVIDRWEGWLLTLLYAAYLAYLVLDAQGHDALQGLSTVMVGYVAPIIVVGLAGHLVHERTARARAKASPGR